MARDFENPRWQPCLISNGGEFSVNLEEDFLNHIFRVGRMIHAA